VALDELLDFRWTWQRLAKAELLQGLGHVDLDCRVLANGHRPHKVVRIRDELLLEVEGAVVEVEQLGDNLERHQKLDRLAVPYGRSVLDYERARYRTEIVSQACSVVIVQPGKVKFPKVFRVVHVSEEVQVVCPADGFDHSLIGHLQRFPELGNDPEVNDPGEPPDVKGGETKRCQH